MPSNNTVYENSVIEAKMNDLFETKLNIRNLLTIDDSLSESAGLRKTINKYSYMGEVERLNKGYGNSLKGTVTFTPKHYDVKRYQQTFVYNDIDVMGDPYVVEVGIAGQITLMVNNITDETFIEFHKSANRHIISGTDVTYDDIVDALAKLNREVEDGMFIIMGADARKAIRKDSDFISSHQGDILYTGQFGTLCGLPVIFSKKVSAGQVIISSKDAVRFFVKKESTVEQARNIETKENTIVYERHGLIALVDDTATVIIGKAADALTLTATGTGTSRTIAITEEPKSVDDYFVYALNSDAPLDDEDLRGWDSLAVNNVVPNVKAGDVITVAEINDDGYCVASGTVTVE